MTVHIHYTDIFINLEINFWTVLFWDLLILYQIDDTEISNGILLYLITFFVSVQPSCLCLMQSVAIKPKMLSVVQNNVVVLNVAAPQE